MCFTLSINWTQLPGHAKMESSPRATGPKHKRKERTMNANAFQITDTIGNAGAMTVDLDTATEQVAAWYGAGEQVPAEVYAMIERATDALTSGYRDGDAEDFLGLAVEQA